jgi:hypothetical protein|tara:strand:- start:1459 stop:2871 length:1413 start_codon:yes stop_codon:yes gene_type:complete
MATIIEQKPLYTQTPVGQDVIFVVSNSNIVSTQTRVKFQAEVHISNTFAPNTAVADDVVGKFKTTPNNAGVGIFNLRSVIENYVSADNMARINSTYKGETTTDDKRHPLHLIDKFSGNVNLMRYLVIQFKTEYFDTTTNQLVQVEAVNSNLFQIFNGYLTYADVLDVSGSNFGFDMSDDFLLTSTKDKFLTNAPIIQYANVEDYGTVAMFTPKAFNDQLSDISYIRLTYKDSSGSSLGSENISRNTLNGAYDNFNAYIGMNVLYFGCFPANLRNWSPTFKALVTAGTIQGGEIGVEVYSTSPAQISSAYTIKVNCPDLKGYESVRLCWLNQYGVWDYYTFTKKSTKSITTQGTTYNQLEGSWNESRYRLDSFKGGKKTFRVNSTERISMNTDYITESESIWLEELINSPEVYILKGQTGLNDQTGSALNQYVIPVRLMTSSYTRKTIANDKLIQYTFEVEKTKTLRTQAI